MRSGKLLMLLFTCFIVSVKAQTTDEGIKALNYENYTTARRIFTQLKNQQPDNALNYYYLGITYCILEKFDSARIIFNAGTQADPKSIHNYVGLGRTYLEQNNVQQATQYFDKARSLTSQKDIMQYILIADAYTSAAHPNYDMAVSLLNKAIEYTNKNAEVYWLLGKTYEAMNKSGEAVSAYERDTELNPIDARAYTRMAVIWRNAQNGILSKESIDKALKADPKFPPAYRELAELYFYTGKYDLATETFQKYRDLADNDDNTQFRYGQFLFVSKKYKDALNILQGLRSKIDAPVMHRLLGYSYYETGNYTEGFSEMEIFFQKTDSAKIRASDYEYLGKLQLKTGKDSLAILTLQKVIRLDSSKYALYDTIGTYLYKQKKYAQAGEFYVKKIAALPKNAPFNEVANSYRQAGLASYWGNNFIVSDSIFTKASKLSPQWAFPYLFLARIQLNIDSLDTVRGKAFPFYNLFISKAFADTVHYKRDLAEAYQYLGNYNTQYRNYGTALNYFDKVIALDPANKEVIETVKAIKDRYKGTPGSPIYATKDTTGFSIPAIINGNSMNVLYDPGIMGIAVTPEGSSQLFGSKSSDGNLKVDILKIGDRSLKNVRVTLVPEEKKPVAAVGPDVLNKMNIVFDYVSGALLQL